MILVVQRSEPPDAPGSLLPDDLKTGRAASPGESVSARCLVCNRKFGLRQVPCMIALVRNINTDKPQAIHRTALDLSGNKVEVNGCSRMSLGPVGGGAVKLTDNAEVTTCLGIGEGIESTLSLRSIPEFGASPVWSLLSAGGIEVFPVLAGIECLWIAIDNDQHGRGQQAAQACSNRWKAASQEVFRITPNQLGDDLNNLAQRRPQ
jgi:putative DNA primase/helicase